MRPVFKNVSTHSPKSELEHAVQTLCTLGGNPRYSRSEVCFIILEESATFQLVGSN